VEVWSEKLRVGRRNTEDDERAGISQHRGANIGPKAALCIGSRDKNAPRTYALRKQRGDRLGAEVLQLVDMDEERPALLGGLVATRHGNEL